MGRRGSSRRARRTGRQVIGVSLGLVAAVLVICSALFDHARAGRFPATAASVLAPCCRLSPFRADAAPARALGEAPLAAFPFWDAAGRAKTAGDMPRARSLAREAVRRDPRLADARLWLAQDAIASGRFDEAITQLDWLHAVAPGARPAVATAVAQLAMLPAASQTVERHAARSPEWLQGVMENLSRLQADPALLFRISGGSDVRSGLRIGDKSAVIRDLLARKDYDRAYLAWVASLPAGAVGSVGYVYDSAFENLPGLQPFNWSLTDSDIASVEYARGGGVAISYFGDGSGRFLEQYLMMPPGAFRLRIAASRSGEGEPNKAVWTLSCAEGGGGDLATLDVPVGPSPRMAEVPVRVPQGCPVQVLHLDGTPSEYPTSTSIMVRSVGIVGSGTTS